MKYWYYVSLIIKEGIQMYNHGFASHPCFFPIGGVLDLIASKNPGVEKSVVVNMIEISEADYKKLSE